MYTAASVLAIITNELKLTHEKYRIDRHLKREINKYLSKTDCDTLSTSDVRYDGIKRMQYN